MSGRCVACNRVMSDFEMTRKSATTGEYLDLCDICLDEIKDDFELIEREDLRTDIRVDLESEPYTDEIEND